MEKLPPIPTPLGTRWREFRIRYVPLFTFLFLLGVVGSMWRYYVIPPSVLAEVEPITANVISTQPGLLLALKVDRLDRVTNGQEIAVVQIMETNVLAASMAVISANLDLKQSQLDLLVNREGMIYTREYLVYLQERIQHNADKEVLVRYEADFVRASNLFHAKPPLLSQAQYDQAKALYQKTKVNVEQTEQFLAEKEKMLPLLRVNSSNLSAAITRDIKAQAERLLNVQSNLTLRAPIDGTVSAVNHRIGERVMAGNPVVVITPRESDRIIAYVRQPMNVIPKTNDLVQVRRQTFKREVGTARVIQVGSQLERIDPALLAVQGGNLKVEMALPFLLRMQDNKLNLSPGERVDVILKSPTKPVAN